MLPRAALGIAIVSLGLLQAGAEAFGLARKDPPPAPPGLLSAAPPAPAPLLPSQPLDPPAAAGALAPRWTASARGPLLTWLEPTTLPGKKGEKLKGHRLRISRWAEGGWTAPVTIAQGTRFFANWADTPGAVEGADGTLYAHWLEKSGKKTYDYGIRLARSRDGGATWQPLGKLNRDGALGEHGFVSWVREGANVRAFWVDGRDSTMNGKEEHIGAMALRSALVSGAEGTVEADVRLDGRICDCCQTGAAMGPNGPVVVYRDRSAKEIRDISVIRWAAPAWSEPARLANDGWEIPGCPVNGPAIAAHGQGLAVAWFTGAAPAVRVQVAFSLDGGATFGRPLVVDDGTPIGRVDLAFDADGSAIASWYAFAGEGAALRLRRARFEGVEGRLGPTVTLATTTPGRSSGFPRLIRLGDKLLVAWIDDRSPQHLRVASLPASAIP